eukprot:NODE_8683_length_347_cov_175.530201_g6925_i0.p4 GENE.NODE_8683_length_347_cov_175.530201_g6925_i0~~NODE_8683_length_347_cov_175.530201_g6925_i0.p4  ORF type:complete len:50 (+),score=2.36 NODE_8683_length_347_cov_175.530201_g6925_i0:81-230(+)
MWHPPSTLLRRKRPPLPLHLTASFAASLHDTVVPPLLRPLLSLSLFLIL